MPDTAVFFSQRLTFTSHADFPSNAASDSRTGAIDAYLFNSNTIESEQITALAKQYLHPHEQVIFAKRKQLQAKQEYLASRFIIKTYASEHLGYDFDALCVLFDDKDSCLNVYHHDEIISLRCCISHSHGQVLIALVSTKNMSTTNQATIPAIKLGVDLEWISTKRSLAKVAKHYYHAQELQACLAQIEDDVEDSTNAEEIAKAVHAMAWYRIWTLKEALAKAIKQPIAKLLRDNVFESCQPLNVYSGCYEVANKEHGKAFDLSIISDIELTDNANIHINILTASLDQDFRKVK